MLHTKQDPARSGSVWINPLFADEAFSDVAKHAIADEPMSAGAAAQIVADELMVDGNARLNLATFVTTWMEPEARRLMRVTEESLELAIQQVRAGNRLFDVCGTVERHVVSNGFSIVREFVGHGIGTKLHEEPQNPNYVDRKNENPRLKEGMVLAIEPMVNAGGPESKVRGDKWTAVTKDGSFSAHFEHCVAVTENGPWVLTRP